MAKGLFLNSLNHDIEMFDGELRTVNDADEISRNIKTRLKINTGEYKLDITYGFPYRIVLGAKIFNLSELETLIKQYILDTEGVTQLTSFNLDYVGQGSRKLFINFTALTIFGRIVVSQAVQTGGATSGWDI